MTTTREQIDAARRTLRVLPMPTRVVKDRRRKIRDREDRRSIASSSS